MPGIIPPFCLKFRMGEMVLRERKSPSWKGAFEVVGEEIRSGEVEKKDYTESGFCHSEEQGDEESNNNKRFFAEFILSPKIRPFVSLRVTGGEGLKMTRTEGSWN